MTAVAIADVQARLKALFDRGTLGPLTDVQLLERFAGGSSEEAEAAFALLVERHAAMVFRVCRATLGHRQDAEDAAQAVFLVLARHARSVRRSQSTASWLHGTARRTALRARRDASRRAGHERRRAEMTASEVKASPSDPLPGDTWEDLHREIERLPEPYRAAIILRHFEGLSHEECATRLGCPLRTFQSRLLRARDRLRDRLSGRGISPAFLLTDAPAHLPDAVDIPAGWVETTARTARAFAAGQAVAATCSGASPTAVALAGSTGAGRVIAPFVIAGVVAAAACIIAVATPGKRGGPLAMEAQPPPRPQPAAPPRQADGRAVPAIELRVVEKAGGAPIEGAEVSFDATTWASMTSQQASIAVRRMTDADGRCRLEIPGPSPRWFRIDVRKPGYADRSYGQQNVRTGSPIPASHTIEMERGTSIGGVVKRRDGTPVAGARLLIIARTPSMGQVGDEDFTLISDQENAKVVTDSLGRWRFDGMPSQWGYLYLRFAHPDFVPPSLLGKAPAPSEEDLKALRAETILDEGLAVEGRVLDEEGRPIAGGSVRIGAGPRWHTTDADSPPATSDAEGRFRFGHVPLGSRVIGATAAGRAPSHAELDVAPGMKPIEIRLPRGRKLTGRVVDTGGKPIEGVAVTVMNKAGQMPLGWTSKTDADGRFVWDSAPAAPISLFFTREGYITGTWREARADKPEIAITMRRPLRIRGKVTDAKTGRPIPRFWATEGATTAHPPDRLGAALSLYQDGNQPGQIFTDGVYDITCSHTAVLSTTVRIDAEGHRPATSWLISMDAGEASFDAKLEPASDIVGVVQGRDGRPLPEVDLRLRTYSQVLVFRGDTGGHWPQSRFNATTDARGRFRFSPQAESFLIFASHAEGFADVEGNALAEGKPITLTPWGRVAGFVKIGRKPAARVAVTLSELQQPYLRVGEGAPITQQQTTWTDSEGRYAFERVLPATLMVSRPFTPERPGSRATGGAWQRVTVESGKTANVDLGGKGRAVIGRFVLPAGVNAEAVFPYLGPSLQGAGAEIPYPPALDEKHRQAWAQTWLETKEGQAYDRSHAGGTTVLPDGHFRIEDVLPGRYRLRAFANEPGKGGDDEVGPLVAKVDVPIIVPGASGGDPDQPFDAGTISMEPYPAGP